MCYSPFTISAGPSFITTRAGAHRDNRHEQRRDAENKSQKQRVEQRGITGEVVGADASWKRPRKQAGQDADRRADAADNQRPSNDQCAECGSSEANSHEKPRIPPAFAAH